MEIEYEFGCMVVSDIPRLTQSEVDQIAHLDMRIRAMMVTLNDTVGDFEFESVNIDAELRNIRTDIDLIMQIQRRIQKRKNL